MVCRPSMISGRWPGGTVIASGSWPDRPLTTGCGWGARGPRGGGRGGPAGPPPRAVALGLLPTGMLAGEALGAAGAGGQGAILDLRYGREALDAAAAVLDRRHPPREALVQCYHYLKDRGRRGSWVWPPGDREESALASLPIDTLSAALEIFVEAGVITAEGGGEGAVRYTVTDPAGRADLDRSLRYREGTRERAAW